MPSDRRLSLVLERERVTKTKVRYEPAAGEPAVGALYLDAAAVAELGSPDRLTATLTLAEEPAAAAPIAA